MTASKFLAITSLTLILLSLSPGSARAQTEADAERDLQLLDTTKPVKQELSGGKYDLYRIMVRTDQYISLVVEQRGIDVGVKLYQPDGKLVAQSNRLNGAYGPETISWVAATSGFYKLEVRPQPGQIAGAYEVKIVEERVATFQDRSRIPAQVVFMEAEGLREQRTPDSLDQSLAKYKEALQAWRDVGNSYGEAETLNVIGLIYDLLKKDHLNACQNFGDALKIWKLLGDHRNEAESLSNIARANESLGEKQTALNYYNRSLQSSLEAGDRYGEAWTLFNLGRVYSSARQSSNALRHFTEALTRWQQLHDFAREATTLNSIGQVHSSLNEYGKARDFYLQALKKWQDAGDLNGEASTLFALSRTYGVLGHQEKEDEFKTLAEQTKQKAEQARLQSPEQRAKSDKTLSAEKIQEKARTQLLEATDAARRQAIEKYEEAAGLYDSAGEYEREAFVLFDMSSVYRLLGDKRNEDKTLDRAVQLAERIGKASLQAEALQRMADFYLVAGNRQKAVAYYDRAIEIWRRQGDRRSEAYVLGIAAKAYDNVNENENEQAIDYLQRALKLYHDLGDRVREAYTLNDLAQIHKGPDERQKTLEYLKRVRDLRRDTGDRTGEAETLKQIVAVYLSMGAKRKALEYYHQTLFLYRQIKDGLGEAEILRDLMTYWIKEEHPRLAIFYGKQAINTYQQVRRNILGLEKDTQTSFLKSKEDVYRELADLLISEDRLPEAQQVLDMLKEEEYNNFIRGRRKKEPSANERAELTPKEKEAYEVYVEVTKLATTQSALYDKLRLVEARDINDPELKALREKMQAANVQFEEYLDRIPKSLLSEEDKNKIIASKGYQGLMSALEDLGPGSVVLYTLFVKDKYRVVLFTPHLKVARQYSITKKELDAKIMALRSALQREDGDFLQPAKDLYNILIAPMAKDLEGAQATTLMWSLDGMLKYVPIAVLHDGQKYMVERYRNEVFTLASIARLPVIPKGPWRGLGFGVSKFEPGRDQLPAVKKELESIIRNEDDPHATGGAVPGKVVLNDEFTREAMTSLLLSRKYKLVHFASHFDFKPGDPRESYLVLGKGEKLSVFDLSTMTTIFKDVDLLTLSACNTGTNSNDGQEIDNFGEVAQQQGAMAVIASLWAVDDESTALLMEKFYQFRVREANPMSKADALREAQLALLRKEVKSGDKDYAHPYFWAPFILIGNWK